MSYEITRKSFQKLLKWLDSDEEKAVEKYGHIYSALVKIFYSYGFQNAEDLTDETIDRVIAQIETLEKNFEGEKIKYFMGVARLVKLENFRKKENFIELTDQTDVSEATDFVEEDTSEENLEDLKKCLKKLNIKDRRIVLGYYNVTQNAKKKDVHKNLAKKSSLTLNNLRVQVFRLKQKITDCLEKSA